MYWTVEVKRKGLTRLGRYGISGLYRAHRALRWTMKGPTMENMRGCEECSRATPSDEGPLCRACIAVAQDCAKSGHSPGFNTSTAFQAAVRRMRSTLRNAAACAADITSTPPDIFLDVTRAEWSEALDYCREHDVENGGCFDARMLAINIWSHPWNVSPESRQRSRLLISYYPAFCQDASTYKHPNASVAAHHHQA